MTPQTAQLHSLLFKQGNLRSAIVATISLLLSAWLMLLDPTINRDGIFYLVTAQTYLQEGFTAASKVYEWPFHLALFSELHRWTGLELHNAAYLTTSLCFMLMSCAFIKLTQQLGASQRIQLFALIVIICHPLMASYRTKIMRDPGFWAFTLLGLLELLRYQARPQLLTAVKWLGYSGIALLFRVEGAVLMLAGPIALLLSSKQGLKLRLLDSLKFISPVVVFAVIALALIAVSGSSISQFKLVAEAEFYTQILQSLGDFWQQKSLLIADHILEGSAIEDANWALLGSYLAIFGINIFRAITPIYVLILLLGWQQRDKVIGQNPGWHLVNWLAVTVAAYLFLFTIGQGFMLERYSFQLFILLALYLPFLIDRIWQRHQGRWARIAIVVVLSGYTLDAFHKSSYHMQYIIDAAEWIDENTPAERKLVTNTPNIAYFSNRNTNWKLAMHGVHTDIYSVRWFHNRTYAVRIKKRNLEAELKLLQDRQPEIIKVFDGRRGGQVIVFQKGRGNQP